MNTPSPIQDPVVLTISSQVAYGLVGNCATVPALQMLGFEVLAIPTVLLAHHPGHGPAKGRLLPADELADLLQGLTAIGALARCCAVLTGYLGLPGTATVAVDAVTRLRQARPGALYLCDPVIGDNGRVYVRDGVEQAIRSQLLPLANIVTPNHFELERLSGRAVQTLDQAIDAGRSLVPLGPGLVVITSVQHGAASTQAVESLAVTADQVWRATAPRLPSVQNGAGDLLAALLLGHLARGTPLPDALGQAVSAVQAVLAASAGEPEMRLSAARQWLQQAPEIPVQRLR